MTTTSYRPRIVQICRMENVNSETLLALGSDGLVYERTWNKDRQRYRWTNRYDPLPASDDLI
jgi:hypothetical protein